MEKIPSLSQVLKTLFFEVATQLAKEQNVIKRERCFSATSLLLVLVLGWLQHPLAGPSQLARFAHTVGVRVSKQAIAQRLSEKTAHWLRCVLEAAVSTILFASSQTQGLLARFPAVILEDASSVRLPDALAFLWKGKGGSGPLSSVKLGVRWDIRSGQLQGPLLQDGKSHETHNPVHALSLPVGGVWIGDAGYYCLHFLRQLASAGIFFVTRPRGNLAVSTLDGQRFSLAPYLRQQTGKVIDLSVRLGSIPALWLPARLLALPVSPEIAEQRRAHLREKAKSQARGNSGVYIQGRYEVQILDSYQNPTYANGSCGALYGQYAPLVNACRPPEQWQTYDIVFHAAKCGPDGPRRRTFAFAGAKVEKGLECSAPITEVKY